MSTSQNVGVVDASSSTSTEAYFNNFTLGTISNSQNDSLTGYFETYTGGNRAAAQTLASAVIYTSLVQGMNPMEVLQRFTELPIGQVDAFLATFLNLNRVGTSLLGLNNQPGANKYVKRAILT